MSRAFKNAIKKRISLFVIDKPKFPGFHTCLHDAEINIHERGCNESRGHIVTDLAQVYSRSVDITQGNVTKISVKNKHNRGGSNYSTSIMTIETLNGKLEIDFVEDILPDGVIWSRCHDHEEDNSPPISLIPTVISEE
jgi:chemotaxis protein CheY-P-specific phosphatase CheC